MLYTARWWRQAFENKGFPDGNMDSSDKVRNITDLPELDVVVSEQPGVNNTLYPSTCPGYKLWDETAIHEYGNNTVQDVVGAHLQKRLHPAKISLSGTEVVFIMSVCAYDTFGKANVTDGQLKLDVSPICHLFSPKEWRIFDYYLSLLFYYWTSAGNRAYRGGYQGYLRELYARLNDSPVPLDPILSINTTTLANGGFPLPGKDNNVLVYGDFSHDGNIAPIAQAFGLFPSEDLPYFKHAEKHYKGPFAMSKVAPFQTKHAYEKIACEGHEMDYLRVRINEAVHPIFDTWCPVDKHALTHQQKHLLDKGLCPLPVALKNLEWVNGAGAWEKDCFAQPAVNATA